MDASQPVITVMPVVLAVLVLYGVCAANVVSVLCYRRAKLLQKKRYV